MEIRSPKGRKFSSLVQFQNYLQQDLNNVAHAVLTTVAEEVKQEMVRLIDQFYSVPETDYYERTETLRHAVESAQSKVYKTKEGWKIRISIVDVNDMVSGWAREKGMFNSYMDFSGRSTYGGKRYTEWVVDWVDKGGIAHHPPIHFTDEINQLLDRRVQEGILREMKRAGYNLYR